MTRSNDRPAASMRPVKFSINVNEYAEGSALVEFGRTRVLCTATVEETVPQWLKGKSQGWVTAEYGMLPRSTHTRSKRERDKLSGRTLEIQRLVGRALRSVVDMKRLGERTIIVDCDVIQADGGTRTASITGAFVALVLALQKMREHDQLRTMPVQDFVAATSIGIVEGMPMLDLAYIEDSKADVDMNVVMTEDGKLIEVQGTAEGAAFERAQLDAMLDLAAIGIRALTAAQRAVVAAAGS